METREEEEEKGGRKKISVCESGMKLGRKAEEGLSGDGMEWDGENT